MFANQLARWLAPIEQAEENDDNRNILPSNGRHDSSTSNGRKGYSSVVYQAPQKNSTIHGSPAVYQKKSLPSPYNYNGGEYQKGDPIIDNEEVLLAERETWGQQQSWYGFVRNTTVSTVTGAVNTTKHITTTIVCTTVVRPVQFTYETLMTIFLNLMTIPIKFYKATFEEFFSWAYWRFLAIMSWFRCAIQRMFKRLPGMLTSVSQTVSETGRYLIETGSGTVGNVSATGTEVVKTVFQTGTGAIQTVFDTGTGALRSVFERGSEAIQTLFETTCVAVRSVFDLVHTFVKGVFDLLQSVITGYFELIHGAVQSVSDVVSEMVGRVSGMVSRVVEHLAGWVQRIREGIQSYFEMIFGIASAVFGIVVDSISHVFESVSEVFHFESKKLPELWPSKTLFADRINGQIGNGVSDSGKRLIGERERLQSSLCIRELKEEGIVSKKKIRSNPLFMAFRKVILSAISSCEGTIDEENQNVDLYNPYNVDLYDPYTGAEHGDRNDASAASSPHVVWSGESPRSWNSDTNWSLADSGEIAFIVLVEIVQDYTRKLSKKGSGGFFGYPYLATTWLYWRIIWSEFLSTVKGETIMQLPFKLPKILRSLIMGMIFTSCVWPLFLLSLPLRVSIWTYHATNNILGPVFGPLLERIFTNLFNCDSGNGKRRVSGGDFDGTSDYEELVLCHIVGVESLPNDRKDYFRWNTTPRSGGSGHRYYTPGPLSAGKKGDVKDLKGTGSDLKGSISSATDKKSNASSNNSSITTDNEFHVDDHAMVSPGNQEDDRRRQCQNSYGNDIDAINDGRINYGLVDTSIVVQKQNYNLQSNRGKCVDVIRVPKENLTHVLAKLGEWSEEVHLLSLSGNINRVQVRVSCLLDVGIRRRGDRDDFNRGDYTRDRFHVANRNGLVFNGADRDGSGGGPSQRGSPTTRLGESGSTSDSVPTSIEYLVNRVDQSRLHCPSGERVGVFKYKNRENQDMLHEKPSASSGYAKRNRQDEMGCSSTGNRQPAWNEDSTFHILESHGPPYGVEYCYGFALGKTKNLIFSVDIPNLLEFIRVCNQYDILILQLHEM